MCGRAKLPDDVSEIKLDLKIDFDQIGDYQPRWNAAPTSKLPVVVAMAGRRTLTSMRWGLIPSWAKEPQARLFDLQCARRNPGDTPRLPQCLASRTPLSCPCRWLLRVARCR
jgi:putative SOS response-associated peptidase YedK